MEETEKNAVIDSEKLDIPINEYYQLILNEYNNERGRKQSIETRSGIILTLIAAFFAFVLKEICLSDFICLFDNPLTFKILITILSGFNFLRCFFSKYNIFPVIYKN